MKYCINGMSDDKDVQGKGNLVRDFVFKVQHDSNSNLHSSLSTGATYNNY